MIKLLIFSGVRNAELANVRLRDVDSNGCQIRIEQGKGKKDRYVLFPKSFRGELGVGLPIAKKFTLSVTKMSEDG
jgi:integrase/recombinase XerD